MSSPRFLTVQAVSVAPDAELRARQDAGQSGSS
jgi:hypothetical protein